MYPNIHQASFNIFPPPLRRVSTSPPPLRRAPPRVSPPPSLLASRSAQKRPGEFSGWALSLTAEREGVATAPREGVATVECA